MTPKDEILGLETRRKIYKFILKKPGLHFSEISRKLKIPKTTLNHHLNYLKKHGLITSIYEEKNSRFFVAQNFGNLEKKLIHLLRKETPRSIILYIGWNIFASQSELSRELEKSNKTIEKHLKKLLELGVIEPAPIKNGMVSTAIELRKTDCKPIGREVYYRLALSPYANLSFGTLIGELFDQYKNGLADDKNTKLILDGFKLIDRRKQMHYTMKIGKSYIENLEKIGYDIFPHPYHV